MIQLSVLIVNYKVPYFLEQCLLSVQAAIKDMAVEIIVVDNNSSDNSCSMIRDRFKQVRLIANKENVGFSRANNQGVFEAKGDYVLILNPDTLLAEDLLEKILAFAEKKKNFGAIGVRFVDGTGNFLPECKRNIPTLKIAGQKILGISKNYYANHIPENEVAKTEVLTGAFMLMKKSAYIKVGGFDEDYFMFGEDIDLSYKLLKEGYQNYYFGKATLLHYKGESSIKDKGYLQNFYGAMQIFYRKHYPVNKGLQKILGLAVKVLVSINASSGIVVGRHHRKIKNLLFLGDNKVTYELVINRLEPEHAEMVDQLVPDYLNFDMVIFDNNFMSNKEIIKNIIRLKCKATSKRIIPKNTSYFLGSESARDRGDAVLF